MHGEMPLRSGEWEEAGHKILCAARFQLWEVYLARVLSRKYSMLSGQAGFTPHVLGNLVSVL